MTTHTSKSKSMISYNRVQMNNFMATHTYRIVSTNFRHLLQPKSDTSKTNSTFGIFSDRVLWRKFLATFLQNLGYFLIELSGHTAWQTWKRNIICHGRAKYQRVLSRLLGTNFVILVKVRNSAEADKIAIFTQLDWIAIISVMGLHQL